MDQVESWLHQFGPGLIFLNVLMDCAGLPLPSFPLLLLCGALLAKGGPALYVILPLALAGALCADLFWYFLGRSKGRRLLATLCKMSLSPDSCVRQTESIYLRFGPASLLVAKFVPGFAVIAASMAGQMRISFLTFLLIDTLGILLWVGTVVTLGVLAGPLVNDLVTALQAFGKWGLMLLAGALFAYLAWKWQKRQHAKADLAIPRVTIDELRQMLDAQHPVQIVDVRSPEIQALEGRIPDSIALSVQVPDERLSALSEQHAIVVYCGCPNEVSAVHLVKRLRLRGFVNAHPLAGDVEAWREAGLPMQHDS